MKYFLLVLFSFCCSLAMQAADGYAVFKVSGRVTVKTEQGWIPLNKRDKLHGKDMLHIPVGGKVAILEVATNRIYTSVSEGDLFVLKVISEAKKQSDNIVANVNGRIRQVMEERKDADYTYSVPGASHRGESDEAYTMQVYSALLHAAKRAGASHGAELKLDVQHGEDSFFFCLTNDSDRLLFVNVLRMSKSGQDLSLVLPVGYACEPPCLLLPPHTSYDASSFLFAAGGEDASYLLFGTERAFDTSALQLLLSEGVRPNAPTEPLHLSVPVDASR